MLQPYKTLLSESQAEIVIQRSRFINFAKPVQTENEALDFLATIRKKYWDATHHVWAYILGAASLSQRFSDDGEPQGTAGIPTLEVIRKEGLVDVIVVVVRYFGGIKLGGGGLVRAYTQGAKEALTAGKVIERIPYYLCTIETDYAYIGKFQREFEQRKYPIKDIAYTDTVTFQVLVPRAEAQALDELTKEWTAGQAQANCDKEVYVNFHNDQIISAASLPSSL